MKCDEALVYMSCYFDKQLNREEEQELMDHISHCSHCQKEFTQMQKLIEELTRMPLLDLPSDFEDELWQKLELAKKEMEEMPQPNQDNTVKKKEKRKYSWKQYGTIAAAFLVLVAVGATAGNVVRRGSMGAANSSDSQFATEESIADGSVEMAQDAASAPLMMSREAPAEADMSSEAGLGVTTASQMQSDNSGLTVASTSSEDLQNSAVEETQSSERIQIKTLYVNMEVKDFDQAVQEITASVENNGGYVESMYSDVYYSDTAGQSQLKQGSITVRVPKEQYETAKSGLETLGTIQSIDETTEDVTSQYVDTESRLNTKKAEETRLLELLNQAETVEDIIKIEERLGILRADIESYEAMLLNWDRLSQLSTITIDLREVGDSALRAVDSSLGNQLKNRLIDSVNQTTSALQVFLLNVAGAWVPFLVLAAAVIIVIVAVKRKIKRKREKGRNSNEE